MKKKKTKIYKTKEEIEEMRKEPRYFISYFLVEDGLSRWIRMPFMRSEEIVEHITNMVKFKNEFSNLEITDEMTLDLIIDTTEESNLHLLSYDFNEDAFGNIIEGAVHPKDNKPIPLKRRTEETELKSLRCKKYDSRYCASPTYPFVERYNSHSRDTELVLKPEKL